MSQARYNNKDNTLCDTNQIYSFQSHCMMYHHPFPIFLQNKLYTFESAARTFSATQPFAVLHHTNVLWYVLVVTSYLLVQTQIDIVQCTVFNFFVLQHHLTFINIICCNYLNESIDCNSKRLDKHWIHWKQYFKQVVWWWIFPFGVIRYNFLNLMANSSMNCKIEVHSLMNNLTNIVKHYAQTLE